MMRLLVLPFFLGATFPAHAQIQGQPIVADGMCSSESGVTVNEELSQFDCNGAVIVRTDRGTVLIQFIDKTGDDGRILGFAGMIEGKQGFGADTVQMMAVERLYLAGNAQPITTRTGTCIMNWSGLQRLGGKLISVVCGAGGEIDGYNIRALAALQVQD